MSLVLGVHCGQILFADYCREVLAPAARSETTPRKLAAACSSESDSKSIVATMCGESGPKRTFSKSWPRVDISV